MMLLFWFAPFKSFAGGLSAWQEETPYGHEIEHDGTEGGWIRMQLDSTSITFQNFYFYKHYTVAYSDAEFYIVNEKTAVVQRFVNKQQWESALNKQDLEPFWKREYNDNYGVDKAWAPLLLIFLPFPFLLPVLWLICVISLFFTTRRFYGFRKHFLWIYPVLYILVLSANAIPQSF
ncbi:hypothetical protein [Pedobacter punctiformis]|uniref:Uncharacterized protein n=1 Tax=Pedobacter punctiformis TaxID=3004097 RepID=A0ABT4LAD5_9SPHI|nr:hypothetical protein [Pedobacter sp. HCMS5-2]MCZ4244128.1 hypothetical protein [Pedobacter sp. HCMS5-2]